MKKTIYLLLLAIVVTAASCKRDENDCETATITGTVRHHSDLIPSAMVYLKHGAKDAPADSRNPRSYDDSIRAGANAVYSFTSKQKGDYYILGIGYDTDISDSVYGGLSFTIQCNSQPQTVTIDVPVVE
jgi:hypothetical protein